MDLSLTEFQKMLKTTAREFLQAECPWTVVKQIDESATGFSPGLWHKIAGIGWLGMNFAESCGGMGCTLTDLAMIYEEMGQALAPGIFFESSVLCGSIIAGLGTEEQKKALLPAINRGETILALAQTEADYGWTPESIQLKAQDGGDKFNLNGVKRFVPDAMIANKFIVPARTAEAGDAAHGISVFLVDRETPGLNLRSLSAFSGEKYFELTFDSVTVPSSNILGPKDFAWPALEKALDRATVILCAYLVGGCQHLLEMTTQYAQTRVQFGQPIGAFQWVQGYIIEQANQLERCRWLTYEALWKIDAGKPENEQKEAVSLAKAVASEAFLECGHLGHEVHAGLGVDKKYPLYLYSKKSKTLYSYLGDPYHHRHRVAKILGL